MNLRDYLLVLRRRKWIGVLVLLITLGTSATLTTLATPLYESTATVFVGPQAIGVNEATASSEVQISLSIAERLTKTYARMIRSLTVAQKAVEDSDLIQSPQYVLNHLQVIPIPDTTLIELRVRDPDPVQASNMANAMSGAFVVIAAELTTPGGADDTNPIVPVRLFERAEVQTEPVSPNASRNLVLAAVLGLVAGLGLMFAAEYLDVAIRGPEDIERLVHLPVLALIPRVARDDVEPRRSPPRSPRVRVPS